LVSAALQDEEIADEGPEPGGQMLQMVLPLCQEDWRPAFLDRVDDVAEDQPIPSLV
jgi:hypothetical protein